MKNKLISIIASACAVLIVLTSSVTSFAANADDMRQAVISAASAEIGYTGTSTTSKYGTWYGYQGSWCTTFVLWCFNEADKNIGSSMYGKIVPSGGNCNSMISWYTSKGLYHKRSSGYTPQSGDLVFFDWSGNGSSQHVGFVNYISGTSVYTIEGNCSGKVKSRKYTASGSKPYNNVSAIMGYASPAYGASNTAKTTTKKTTAKQTTTKKSAATKSSDKSAKSTATKAANPVTTTVPSSSSADATHKSDVTTKHSMAKKLLLYTPSNTLQIGDSVKLSYNVEPADASAVVNYFCDEEGIVSIEDDGSITAVGEGTATVVVCANDELYSQCDFTVESVDSAVTMINNNVKIPDAPSDDTSKNSQSESTVRLKTTLAKIGVNIDILSENTQLYIIPVTIAAATLAISIIVCAIRRIRNKS